MAGSTERRDLQNRTRLSGSEAKKSSACGPSAELCLNAKVAGTRALDHRVTKLLVEKHERPLPVVRELCHEWLPHDVVDIPGFSRVRIRCQWYL